MSCKICDESLSWSLADKAHCHKCNILYYRSDNVMTCAAHFEENFEIYLYLYNDTLSIYDLKVNINHPVIETNYKWINAHLKEILEKILKMRVFL